MSYKIVYVKKRSHSLRFIMLATGFILLFLYCIIQGPEVNALEKLAQELGEGANAADAVAAFCQDVLHGN